MRVLHLAAGNLYGGVETLLATLARHRHLAPEMTPEFGLCFRGRAWDELSAAGATVHDLGGVRVSRPWTVLRARANLRRALAAAKPDVVVAHGCWPHALFAAVVRRAGARLVHFAHGPTAGRHWVERWARRTPPDAVVANSRHTAGSAPNVFPTAPVVAWHLPVAVAPVADRASVRDELATPADAVVIVQASRLEAWKGQAVLVAALGRLRGLPGWACWVAGGPQKPGEAEFLQALQMSALAVGVADRVRFVGQRSDVPRLLGAADVYCQPNTEPEPFGLALVEALAAGLPVVTSGVGGAAEVVNETCGVLTPPGDAAAVAAALAALVADPARRRALGAAGPARARALCHPADRMAELARHLAGVAA